jgi:hypothetical protein
MKKKLTTLFVALALTTARGPHAQEGLPKIKTIVVR